VYAAEAGGLVYDKFCNGSVLTNGWKLEVKSNNQALAEVLRVKRNAGFAAAFTGGQYVGSSNAFGGLFEFDYPILLKGSFGDYIRWTVQDNTSNCIWLASAAKLWRVNE
jgi:hypothetical protein